MAAKMATHAHPTATLVIGGEEGIPRHRDKYRGTVDDTKARALTRGGRGGQGFADPRPQFLELRNINTSEMSKLTHHNTTLQALIFDSGSDNKE